MKQKPIILSCIILALTLIGVTAASAQDADQRGSIRGAVYEDVNGDGVCVNTGVNGENPVANINLEFVSSDEATAVTLHTGDDGTFGLVAAGQSIWRVTVKPDAAKWFVTSENPRYVPVLPDDGLIQTDVNFCISRGATGTIVGGSGSGTGIIILPESGAAAASGTAVFIPIAALMGLALFGGGIWLELKRRSF